MVEHTEDYGGGEIGIVKSVPPGANLIFKGDDVKPGDLVLRKGRRLEPQDIGALAALGVTEIPVVPRLRVGLISTGDELVPPEQDPGPGQVRDVNGPLVAALLAQAGAEAVPLGIVPDREEQLREAVEEALAACDCVVLSGGSSVGEKDAAYRIMASLGEVLCHGVAMKPGKPTLLGRAGGKPILGLPGHPVAALFTAKLFSSPCWPGWRGGPGRGRRCPPSWPRPSPPTMAGPSTPASPWRRSQTGCGPTPSGASLGSSPPWRERTASSASPGTGRASRRGNLWRCPSSGSFVSGGVTMPFTYLTNLPLEQAEERYPAWLAEGAFSPKPRRCRRRNRRAG